MSDELVSITKLYNDRLWIIHMHVFSRQAVDLWERTVREYIATHQNLPQRYLIYDVSGLNNLSFTVYLRERAIVLAQDNREATGRVAIVTTAPATIVHVLDIFLRYTGKALQPALEVKLVKTRDEALTWVSAALPQTQSSAQEA
jgi:hypothetical protein